MFISRPSTPRRPGAVLLLLGLLALALLYLPSAAQAQTSGALRFDPSESSQFLYTGSDATFSLPAAVGGTAPYTYSYSANTDPGGRFEELNFSLRAGASDEPGALGGEDLVTGEEILALTVTDSASPPATARHNFIVYVVLAPFFNLVNPPIEVEGVLIGGEIDLTFRAGVPITSSLVNIRSGTGLSFTHTTNPALPADLSMVGSARDEPILKLSGIASTTQSTTEYVYTYMEVATDGVSQSDDLSFKLTITPGDLQLAAPDAIADSTFIVGQDIGTLSFSLARYGMPEYSYALDGVPAGLSFYDGDSDDDDIADETPTLSSTPAEGSQGEYQLTFTVSDSATPTATTASVTFALTVQVAPLVFDPATVTDQSYVVGDPIDTLTLPSASGGLGDLAYTLGGAPADLSFDTDPRTLSGTPAVGSQGDYQLTFTVSDSATPTAVTVSLTFAVNVQPSSLAFGQAEVPDQNYIVGDPIDTLTLPSASGGVGDLAYTLGGAPADLSFDTDPRTLSGMPAVGSQGDYQLTFTVSDSATPTAATESITFAVNVQPAALVFSPATVAEQSYVVSATIDTLTLPSASGGVGDLAYTLGGAPADLSFDTDPRTLSGAPAEGSQGDYQLTFTVSDSATPTAATVSLTFAVNVQSAALAFGQAEVPDQNYIVGDDIETLTLPAASGGVGDLAYTLGGAPADLSFDADPRTLSGAPAEGSEGDYQLTFTVSDSATPPAIDSITFTVSVRLLPLILDPAAVPDQSYVAGASIATLTLPVVSSGGATPPYTYTLGGAPAGLNFFNGDSNSDGAADVMPTLSGVPAEASQGDNRLTFTARDSATPSTTTSIVFAAHVQLALAFPASATVPDQSYTVAQDISTLQLPEAVGGLGARTYTLVGAPAGLSFDANQRTLAGAPEESAPGDHQLTFTVRDSATPTAATVSLIFAVNVQLPPLVLNPTTVADQNYTVGELINELQLPEASGGIGAKSYTLGGAPADLSFDAEQRTLNGMLAGNSQGRYQLTFTASDSATVSVATVSLTFAVTVDATSLALDPASVGAQNYTAELDIGTLTLPTARGGVPGYSYTLAGAPAGLVFYDGDSNADGIAEELPTLSGAPADGSHGDYSLTFIVSDTQIPAESVSLTFTATVNIASLGFTASSVADQLFTVDMEIDLLQLPEARGGVKPYRYMLGGAPQGLNFSEGDSDSDGFADTRPELRGIPTSNSAGNYQLTFTVRDAQTPEMIGSLTFSATVRNRPLAFNSSTVPEQNYTVGAEIDTLQLPEASGGTGSISYTLSNAPPGLIFNASQRTLSGTPTTEGNYPLVFTATDEALPNASTIRLSFTVIVQSSTNFGLVNQELLPETLHIMGNQHVDAVAGRVSQARTLRNAPQVALGGQDSWAGLLHTHGLSLLDGKQLDSKELLRTSHFVLPLQSSAQLAHDALPSAAAAGSLLAVWGSGDYRKISGDENGVDWEGGVTSVYLGLDSLLSDTLLAGLAVSQSWSDLDYQLGSANGVHKLHLTGLHPYFGWTSERLDLWGTIGFSQGELEITEDTLGLPVNSDADMWTLGLGGRAQLFDSSLVKLHLRGDVLQAHLEVDNSGDDLIGASEVDVSRMRFALEAARILIRPDGSRFEPLLDVGLRYDDGDGNEGAAFEVGAAVRRIKQNLSMEGRVHTLVGRSSFSEWGAQATLQLVPVGGKGLSLQLSSGYGAEAGPEAEQIWQQDLPLHERQTADQDDIRFQVRIGFGILANTSSRRTLLSPYTELHHDGDTIRSTLGLHWQLPPATSLELQWSTEHGADSEAPETKLKAQLRF